MEKENEMDEENEKKVSEIKTLTDALFTLTSGSLENNHLFAEKRERIYQKLETFKTIEEKKNYINEQRAILFDELVIVRKKINSKQPVNSVSIEWLYNNLDKELSQLLEKYESLTIPAPKVEPLNQNLQPMEEKKQVQKLKWLGKPEQFGFIFSELAKHGYIEIPSTNGEASYSKFAKVCNELFEFKSPTTLDNLERVMNPKKNALSDSNRGKFTIPDLKDIS